MEEKNHKAEGGPRRNSLEIKPENQEQSEHQNEEVLSLKQIMEPTEKVKASELYDYDAIPPDINKAKIHGRARKIYAKLTEAQQISEARSPTRKMCGCCGNPYDQETLGLMCSRSEFYHLGAGFPLYFEFIIFSAVLVVIMILISGIYNFVTNVIDDECSINLLWERNNAQFCDSSKISMTSLVNKRFSEKELEISNWLNFATVVVMLFAFHFYRKQLKETTTEVDNSQQTPADFTLVISNLPLKVTDNEIQLFIEKQVFPGKQVKIAKIVRGYNIRNYVLLNRRKIELQLQLLKKDVPNKAKLEAELKTVKGSLDILESKSTELEASPYAYITFEEEKHAEEALDNLGFDPKIKKLFWRMGCYSCFSDVTFKGVKLVVQRAPEPSDILWENLGTERSEKTKRRLVTFFVSIVLLIICFGIIIGINVGKARISNPKHIEETSVQKGRTVGMEIISIVIAFVIMVINNALNYSTRRFAIYESHSTFTDYFISVARRLTIYMFVNTAITLLVTHLILETLWKDGGLLNDVFVVFLITVIVSPLSNIFNPWYFYRLYQRRKAKSQGANCTLTQREANRLFEGPPIDIAQCYANIMKTVWLTAFYAPILPIGLPISLVGMFLSYWTDKYLLLNRFAKPSELGKHLSSWMAEYLELTPFFFAIGNLIFRHMIHGADQQDIDDPILPTLLAIGVSLLHFLIPFNTFAKCCSSGDSPYNYQKSYSDMRVYFNNDYDISNPIYHEDAMKNWMEAYEKAANPHKNRLHDKLKEEIEKNPHLGNPHLKSFNFKQNLQHYAQYHQGLNADNLYPALPNRSLIPYNQNPGMPVPGHVFHGPGPVHVSQLNYNPHPQPQPQQFIPQHPMGMNQVQMNHPSIQNNAQQNHHVNLNFAGGNNPTIPQNQQPYNIPVRLQTQPQPHYYQPQPQTYPNQWQGPPQGQMGMPIQGQYPQPYPQPQIQQQIPYQQNIVYVPNQGYQQQQQIPYQGQPQRYYQN